jgi:DNA-binding MarR family transcriptional regulator
MFTNGVRPPSLLALPSYLTSQVARFGYRLLENCLEAHGLLLGHHAILAALNDFGPLSQQQLADCLAVDKSHLVGRIDHLEERGLVERTKHPTDRRRHQVNLTPDGSALLGRLSPIAEQSQQHFLRALSKSERQTFMAMLRRVLETNDAARLATVPDGLPRRTDADDKCEEAR